VPDIDASVAAILMSFEIHMGDCLEIMPKLRKVDAVICDPPYGITACKWDSVIPLQDMWRECQSLVGDGTIILTANQPFTSALIASNPRDFRESLVWDKNSPTGFLLAKKRHLRVHEDVLIFSKKPSVFSPQMLRASKAFHRNVGTSKSEHFTADSRIPSMAMERFPTSIIRIPSEAQRYKIHPTQKPVALMEYLIRTYTLPSAVVLDFAMGSGTTGIACENTGRDFIGIEKDREIFLTAQTRLKNNMPPLVYMS
jgi:site-specific DNA-methyltransferase (adenine-specific)